jgi:hypothetical protein
MNALNASLLLIDCGRASKKTRGLTMGFFAEGTGAPYNRWGQ